MTTQFRLVRLQSDKQSTHSALFTATGTPITPAIEPPFHELKIMGHTRIPPGRYPLGFHQSPRFNATYSALCAAHGIHFAGMIQFCDVPNFDDVLVHKGNTAADTEACILVGNTVVHDPALGFNIPAGLSAPAFLRVYPILRDAIQQGGAEVVVVDNDGPQT